MHILLSPGTSSKNHQQACVDSFFAEIDIFTFSSAEWCRVPLGMESLSLTLLFLHP